MGSMHELVTETANDLAARELAQVWGWVITSQFIFYTKAAASDRNLIKADAFQTLVKQHAGSLRQVLTGPEHNILKAMVADLGGPIDRRPRSRFRASQHGSRHLSRTEGGNDAWQRLTPCVIGRRSCKGTQFMASQAPHWRSRRYRENVVGRMDGGSRWSWTHLQETGRSPASILKSARRLIITIRRRRSLTD
jgi:hypothetical protein